jgi:hypothetical protein
MPPDDANSTSKDDPSSRRELSAEELAAEAKEPSRQQDFTPLELQRCADALEWWRRNTPPGEPSRVCVRPIRTVKKSSEST